MNDLKPAGDFGAASNDNGYNYEFLKVGISQNGVARLILNRPKKLNAFHAEMIGEITNAFTRLKTDERVQMIVVSGKDFEEIDEAKEKEQSRAFCTGADIGWMGGQTGKPKAEIHAASVIIGEM